MKQVVGIIEVDNGFPVRLDDSGTEVEFKSEPYLLSDGVSVEAPLPVTFTDQEYHYDTAGNLRGVWPVNATGLIPVEPVQPGPMDVVLPGRSVFTNFSREFNLAYPDAVFYLACHYTGDPVISIAHGGEPLTIVKQEREEPHGILSLIAVGRGLTVEAANLTVAAVGGELDGGACRFNELASLEPELSGWTAGDTGQGKPPDLTVTGTNGGILKAVYTRRFVDTSHRIAIGGMTTLFNGYTAAGDEISYDVSVNSGNWVLGAGWSIVGDELVHTGAESTACTLVVPFMVTGSQARRAYCEVDGNRNNRVTLGNGNTATGNGMVGPNSGYIVTGAMGDMNTFIITANGDVRVKEIAWYENYDPISWAFCTTPAVNNELLTFYNYLSPFWTYSVAEIMGEDY